MTLTDLLACPVDHSAVTQQGSTLVCEQGHPYPVIHGIPVLVRHDVPETHHTAMENTRRLVAEGAHRETAVGVDHFVQESVGKTNGNLYRNAVLTAYPIPDIRLPAVRGKRLLDIGCNWGRWTVAAAWKGYDVIGVDPDLEAVLAAQRVCRQLRVPASFVCGDARFLPFQPGVFGIAFSYSVLQHFSKPDAKLALAEVRRVLAPGGESVIQMPNAFGIRSLYHQARHRFRERETFDVRYWTPRELRRTFENVIGPTTVSVDGFFGLGVQASDLYLMPVGHWTVIAASEALRQIPGLTNVADSLYLTSTPA